MGNALIIIKHDFWPDHSIMQKAEQYSLEASLPTYHFSEILILLGIVGLTIPFLQRLKISPVLGFLICGLLAGPYGLAAVLTNIGLPVEAPIQDNAVIHNFSDLGIMFLMFMIGLKLSWRDLWHMRLHIIGLGSCQIVITTFVIFMIAQAFGNGLMVSILLGACFALSSTAMVMQLFEERRMLHSPAGRVSFSILLMQDLAVVPILVMLNIFAASDDQSIWLLMGQSLLIGLLASFAIYVLGSRLLEPLLKYLHSDEKSEWLMSFVLFVLIGTAMLTEAAGLSAALGAFLAGILLAETEHRDRIQSIIAPVKSLLLGVFFLSIGMVINPAFVLENPFWIVLSVIGIGALKAGIIFLLCLAFRLQRKVAFQSAIVLGQSGEFVFVIVAMALVKGLLSESDSQFFMIVTALSMMITPVVEKLATGFLHEFDKTDERH